MAFQKKPTIGMKNRSVIARGCGWEYKISANGNEETLRGEGNVLYLDHGHGYMSLYIYHNSENCMLTTSEL